MPRWWKDVVGAMPTVQAIRRIRKRPAGERGAFSLLLIIAFYGVVALITPRCGPLQRRLFESYHYRPRSFASWVLLQPERINAYAQA